MQKFGLASPILDAWTVKIHPAKFSEDSDGTDKEIPLMTSALVTELPHDRSVGKLPILYATQDLSIHTMGMES